MNLEFDWVTIPAGNFLMGSEEDEQEEPPHEVYVPEYYMARLPVTNEQWAFFVTESGYDWTGIYHWWSWLHQKKNIDMRHKPNPLMIPNGQEKHPVVHVNWHDALAFCEWANSLNPTLNPTLNPSPVGRGAGVRAIRLPTEAEWEKAARGTDGRRFPWGNEWPTERRGNFDKRVGYTTPVGAYPDGASPYGVLDMAGNVWEWCSTAYHVYPYRGPVDGYKMARGGSWGSYEDSLRCAYRYYNEPFRHTHSLGFRCVYGLT